MLTHRKVISKNNSGHGKGSKETHQEKPQGKDFICHSCGKHQKTEDINQFLIKVCDKIDCLNGRLKKLCKDYGISRVMQLRKKRWTSENIQKALKIASVERRKYAEQNRLAISNLREQKIIAIGELTEIVIILVSISELVKLKIEKPVGLEQFLKTVNIPENKAKAVCQYITDLKTAA